MFWATLLLDGPEPFIEVELFWLWTLYFNRSIEASLHRFKVPHAKCRKPPSTLNWALQLACYSFSLFFFTFSSLHILWLCQCKGYSPINFVACQYAFDQIQRKFETQLFCFSCQQRRTPWAFFSLWAYCDSLSFILGLSWVLFTKTC